jgi:hypothetical protein
MRKLALLILMAASAQGAIIQINPNEIDITLSTALDSNGNGLSSEGATIYLLGTHLFVMINPGTPGYPSIFSGCTASCISADQVSVGIPGIGNVFVFLEEDHPGQGDFSGSGSALFPGLTPGVYEVTAEAEPLYQSLTGGPIPTGTIVNTIVIAADGPGVSLSPYTFPIPEPGTWMLAGIGVVAFAARKFHSGAIGSRASS